MRMWLLDVNSIFIARPLLALIPAVVLGLLYHWSRSKPALYAAIAWLVYTAWELGMHARWLCSGECNIRVDLLVIYPVLLMGSLLAAALAAWQLPRRGRDSGAL